MSEIVRPTRDGIHGREYISTSVDLGRKLPSLSGHALGRDGLPPLVELPIPVVFNPFPFPLPTREPVLAIARALTDEDWETIRPCFEENARLFDIPLDRLLTVNGGLPPQEIYRKIEPAQLAVLK